MSTQGIDFIEWCSKHNLDPAHAIALRGVLKPNFDPNNVVEVFKDIGKPKFIEKAVYSATTFQVLLEFSKQVTALNIDDEVKISDKEIWTVLKAPSASADSFEDALKKLLSSHGKSMTDVSGIPSTTKEVIVKHMVNTPSPRPSVRRLRQFSGRVPVPNGELDYETWSQLAQQVVRDDSVPDADKKSAITQSLFPPALSILCKLPDSAKAAECLEVLNQVYGTVADGDDMYSLFRDTYQERGEKPSEFLFKLDDRLTKAINHGGAVASQHDRLLLNQFLRGCIYDEALCATLHLPQRKNNPPSYLELLREVRAEEAHSEARALRRQQNNKPIQKKVTAAATSVGAQEDDSVQRELNKLRKEMADLRTARQPAQPSSFTPRKTTSQKQPSQKKTDICYNCGEYGHRCFSCTKPRNMELVQQRIGGRSQQQQSGNE